MADLKLKATALIIILATLVTSLSAPGITVAYEYELGDINHDGIVDMQDALIMKQAWQSRVGYADFNPDCDFNGDGIINIIDVTIMLLHWTRYLNPYVRIMPKRLNLKSQGNWIIAVIVLPRGVNAADVDISFIKLNDTVPASSKISFCNLSNIFAVKFSRQAVITLIRENLGSVASISCKRFYTVTLTVSGKLESGLAFSGSDTIQVIHLDTD